MKVTRRWAVQSISALCVGSFCFTAWGQKRNFQIEARFPLFDAPLASHDLERFPLVSKLGYSYEIFVALPRKPSNKGSGFVLYMLDGNAVFDRLTARALEQVPELTIVGIGYPTPYIHDVVSRSRDYTPLLPEGAKPYSRSGGRPTGEADHFMLFIKEQLKPAIEKRSRHSFSQQAIWGHSFGGLFALYTLLKEPTLFNVYLPVSPSTGWGDNLLYSLAQQVQPLPAWKIKRVFVMLGDQEGKRKASTEENTTETRPSPTTLALVDLLRQRQDIDINIHVLHGLGHGATFAASFPYALQEASS